MDWPQTICHNCHTCHNPRRAAETLDMRMAVPRAQTATPPYIPTVPPSLILALADLSACPRRPAPVP
jgi:hypothetical protein